MEWIGEVIVNYDRTIRLQTPSDRVLEYKILQERCFSLRCCNLLVIFGSTRLQTQTVVNVSKCTLLLSLFPCPSNPMRRHMTATNAAQPHRPHGVAISHKCSNKYGSQRNTHSNQDTPIFHLQTPLHSQKPRKTPGTP